MLLTPSYPWLTTNGGLPCLLTLEQGLLVEFECLVQLSSFLTITVSELSQLGPQVGQSFGPLGQFALHHFDLLLAAEEIEVLRGLPLTHADLTVGIHPTPATDSAGQWYYPVPGFDEDFSLRWQVSAGPTDGTGTAEPGIRTVVVEATYRVRYTIAGVPITDQNSLEASFGSLVTE